MSAMPVQRLSGNARETYLAPGKSYPTAASYQYAIEKGAEHPFAQETLEALRTPGYVMPPFERPAPKRVAIAVRSSVCDATIGFVPNSYLIG